jgi:hypothetical protein
MRKVIKNEIKRNYELKNWFDNYGVVCELFSSEIFKKNGVRNIKNLELDLNFLRENNCKYILSRMPIESFNLRNMLVKKINNKNKNAYLKNVFIYKV